MTKTRPGLDHLTEKEQETLLEFLAGLRDRFDGIVQEVVLFGSRARGEAQPESDMDVLVVLSQADLATSKLVRHLAVEVWLRHGIYVSTRVWSQAHWRRLEELQTLLYQNIRRDGIDLLEAVGPAA
ncbi:MAG TPA: nucleotidyltransferase domain-containing protein [Chloroflexi bacterium]|nr:nucleotidyltransferase domain-containing protein [Chloroflexota bacterium]